MTGTTCTTWREESNGAVGRLVDAALDAADPALAVERNWPDELACINGPVALFAFGKGSVPMTRAALDQLARIGKEPELGLVIAVPGQAERGDDLGMEVVEADHPLATKRNVEAAARLAEMCDGLDETWTALCLISGGGSAHLASPREPMTLTELVSVTEALMLAGATIEELNCVRKHLETLKGGQLAARLAPARVVSLVLSDVLGDHLEVIASGPLAPDGSTFADALAVLDRYRVESDVGRNLLKRGIEGDLPETPKAGHACFARVEQHVLANNRNAVDAVCECLLREGVEIARRDDSVEGESAHLGKRLGLDALHLVPGQAIVAGGETTVRVGESNGTGGRCQELALAAAIELEGSRGITVAAFGTDGRDGPTDAAGAVADGDSVELAKAQGVDAAAALRSHDSNGFFSACNGLITTGPTGTNVNDVWVALRR